MYSPAACSALSLTLHQRITNLQPHHTHPFPTPLSHLSPQSCCTCLSLSSVSLPAHSLLLVHASRAAISATLSSHLPCVPGRYAQELEHWKEIDEWFPVVCVYVCVCMRIGACVSLSLSLAPSLFLTPHPSSLPLACGVVQVNHASAHDGKAKLRCLLSTLRRTSPGLVCTQRRIFRLPPALFCHFKLIS